MKTRKMKMWVVSFVPTVYEEQDGIFTKLVAADDINGAIALLYASENEGDIARVVGVNQKEGSIIISDEPLPVEP